MASLISGASIAINGTDAHTLANFAFSPLYLHLARRWPVNACDFFASYARTLWAVETLDIFDTPRIIEKPGYSGTIYIASAMPALKKPYKSSTYKLIHNPLRSNCKIS
jgi:hypothetical protein